MPFSPEVQAHLDKIEAVAKRIRENQPPVRDPVVIGNMLRQVRLAMNLTQGDMARLFNIPVSRWSMVENALWPCGESPLTCDNCKGVPEFCEHEESPNDPTN